MTWQRATTVYVGTSHCRGGLSADSGQFAHPFWFNLRSSAGKGLRSGPAGLRYGTVWWDEFSVRMARFARVETLAQVLAQAAAYTLAPA